MEERDSLGFSFWKNVDSVRGNIQIVDIARIAGLKYQRLKEQRSDNTLPRVDYAVAIARALNTSCEYLLTGEEPKASPYSEYLPYIERLAKTNPAELGAVRKILGMPAEREETERKIFSVSMKEVN